MSQQSQATNRFPIDAAAATTGVDRGCDDHFFFFFPSVKSNDDDFSSLYTLATLRHKECR